MVACEGGDAADPGTDTDAPPPATCSVPSGEGTVHATAALESDDAVWTAAASPTSWIFRRSSRRDSD
ncbi:hypothetical protein [Nannocystis pusilla]|uniref:hypothetical protein n=1 Tax=Nannocystis pusilla TaxID=889268 RepID=UPI003B7DCF95